MNNTQNWVVLTVTVGLIVLVYLLKPILTPFLVSLLIAYLGDPLVDRLENKGLSRTWSVTVVFTLFMLLITALVLIVVPRLVREVVSLVHDIPQYIVWLRDFVAPVYQRFDISPLHVDKEQLRTSLMENWQSAGGVLSQLIADLSRSGLAMLASLANVALIPVVSFYLLRDWDLLVEKIRDLLPRKHLARTVTLVVECDGVLGAFLRGQLMIMMLLGCIYTVGLWSVGLERSLLIGMIAGLASIVPYLGFIVGILTASVAALFQFQELGPLVYVAVVFAIGQLLEGMVLTPWLMGERIGLHPVAIIFAILAGGQLFGFVGVLLALPVAAVIMVFLRHIHDVYKDSDLYEVTSEDE